MPALRKGPLTFPYLDVGSGFPFIFLHGLESDADDFTPPPGIRLLTFTARAQPQTLTTGGAPDLPFDSAADDVIALLDHLRLPTAIVGGTSSGAGVALNVALLFPERVAGLILARPAWLDGSMAAYVLDLFDRVAGMAWEVGAVQTPPRPRPVRRDLPVGQILLDAAGLQVPTLVLAHHQDPVHPFHYGVALTRAIRGAEFVRLTPPSVDRQRVAAEIQDAVADFLEPYRESVTQLERVA